MHQPLHILVLIFSVYLIVGSCVIFSRGRRKKASIKALNEAREQYQRTLGLLQFGYAMESIGLMMASAAVCPACRGEATGYPPDVVKVPKRDLHPPTKGTAEQIQAAVKAMQDPANEHTYEYVHRSGGEQMPCAANGIHWLNKKIPRVNLHNPEAGLYE